MSQNGDINWQKKIIINRNQCNKSAQQPSVNKLCIIISGYYKDRPFLINLKEIDFSEDYKTDFVIANTFLSSLNKKYLVSSGVERRHRLMEIKKHVFSPFPFKRKVADKKVLYEFKICKWEIWNSKLMEYSFFKF